MARSLPQPARVLLVLSGVSESPYHQDSQAGHPGCSLSLGDQGISVCSFCYNGTCLRKTDDEPCACSARFRRRVIVTTNNRGRSSAGVGSREEGIFALMLCKCLTRPGRSQQALPPMLLWSRVSSLGPFKTNTRRAQRQPLPVVKWAADLPPFFFLRTLTIGTQSSHFQKEPPHVFFCSGPARVVPLVMDDLLECPSRGRRNRPLRIADRD